MKPPLDQLKHCINIYNEAHAAYQSKDYETALRLLREMQALAGRQSLRSLLLEAYIERERNSLLSELMTLERLIRLFGESDDPLLSDAWSLLGAALSKVGDGALASNAFLQSVEKETDLTKKLVEFSNAIFTLNHVADVSADTMQGLYDRYRALLSDVKPFTRECYGHKVLRIGYISGDFRQHPVAYFVYALLKYHDTTRFTVYCYAVNQTNDVLTEQLQRLPIVWRDVRTKDWAEAARIVRDDEIDILVDLSGHTAGNCLPVLAWQPAPVQICGIGYMNSTGLRNVDYFLSDVHCAPTSDSPYFTEKLLRLPRTHLCYTRPSPFPDILSLPPCRRQGFITFGCFNNYAKITDTMLMLWSQILERVPGTRLLLKHQIFSSKEGRRLAENRLVRLGIDVERVTARGFSDEYLSEYNDVDIALDTAPYTGGLTTCEALYMGVPVITLAGNRHGARFGVSLLNNVGLSDLVAQTPEEYVAIAVELANSPKVINGLRHKLRGMMASSPLMDRLGYVREVEEAYSDIALEKGLITP